jgi:hypothetical protein
MRNSDGTFLQGYSGNPSGRPAIISELQKLARTHTPTALATLVEIMSNTASPPNARVSAAVALLDRNHRPVAAEAISGAEGYPLGAASDASISAANGESCHIKRAADAAAGRKLAEQWCARRHNIEKGAPFKLRPPSFASIAVYRLPDEICAAPCYA